MSIRRYISTREEWKASVDACDGKKWTVEEAGCPDEHGNPTAQYVELVKDHNPYATGRDGPAAARARKAREQLKKKVSKPEKGYTWRLGYHRCVGQYTGEQSYPEFSGSSLNRKKYPSKKSLKKDEPAIHIFSDRSKSKVRDKATSFYRAIRSDRIFMTLTFIEHVTDDQGVKILNKFLTVLRKKYPTVQYLWVAEHQPKRDTNTVHYHMILNRKLPIVRYNSLWVMQQYNSGLRGHRSDGSEISMPEIEERFDKGTIGKVLNPVDITKAYGINALAGYLTKYITKQKKEEFRCLNWHCSRKVSRLFTRQIVEPSTFSFLKSFSNYRVDYKTGECQPATEVKEAFFSLIVVNNRKTTLKRLGRMEAVNRWLMDGFLPESVPKLEDDLYRRIWTKPCRDGIDKVNCS